MKDIEENLNKLGIIIQKHEEVFNSAIEIEKKKHKEIPDETFIIMMLFRKITERLDSVFVLLENKSENAVRSIIRDLIENVLYFVYIIAEKRRYKPRALSYYYSTLNDQINLADLLFKNTQRGRKIRSYLEVENDKNAIYQKAKKSKEHFSKALEQDKFRNIKIEWNRLKKKDSIEYPKWYSLFKGPNNLRRLASYCKYGVEYDLLYGIYSSEVHSANVMNQFENVNGLAGIKKLRIYDDPLLELIVTLKFGIETLKRYVEFFDIDKEVNIDKWLKENFL